MDDHDLYLGIEFHGVFVIKLLKHKVALIALLVRFLDLLLLRSWYFLLETFVGEAESRNEVIVFETFEISGIGFAASSAASLAACSCSSLICSSFSWNAGARVFTDSRNSTNLLSKKSRFPFAISKLLSSIQFCKLVK